MSKEDYISNMWKDDETPRHTEHITKDHFDPDYQRVLQEGRQTKLSAYSEKQRQEIALRMEALNRLVQTEDGLTFFRWLCEHLSFKGSILAMANGAIDKDALVFNEARRIIWQDIRNQLNVLNRNRIEEEI